MARAAAVPAKAKPAVAAGSNYPVIKDRAAIQAAAEYAAKLAEVKRLEADLKPLKVTILAAMGEAPEAVFGMHVVSATVISPMQPTENVLITKAMVGQVIKGKPGKVGYTQIRVQ